LRNLTIPVSDAIFDKFKAIQEQHDFKNQSDCLEYIIEQVATKEIEK
jgi:hypothetical protein